MRWQYRINFFIYLIGLGIAFAQPGPFHNAHAHNDYEHQRPLFEALEHGFLSVEADVHLTANGKLLVGHDAVNRHSPSLEYAYLRPLDSLLKVNKGWVDLDPADLDSADLDSASPRSVTSAHAAVKHQPFHLMIDLKTEGQSTTSKLLELLQCHPQLLESGGPVRIILSGNVPKKELLASPFEGLLIDGRPSDLGKGVASERMPWISDRFSNWGTTTHRTITPESLSKIRQLAERVHAEDKKLRLWAIPDHSQAWQQLLDAGVDLINTDNLDGLSAFLSNR